MPNPETITIIQARTASKRLYGKVLKPFCNGYNLLDYCLHSAAKIKSADGVFVATSRNAVDDELARYCQGRAIVYRGGENDVFKRFLDIIDREKPKRVIRICADNPFLISDGIDFLVRHHGECDYTSFTIDHVPAMLLASGLFAECVNPCALKVLYPTATTIEKEHVTYGLYNGSRRGFTCNFIDARHFLAQMENSHLRLTIDTETDFRLIDSIIGELDLGLDIDLKKIGRILGYINEKGLYREMIHENRKTENIKINYGLKE